MSDQAPLSNDGKPEEEIPLFTTGPKAFKSDSNTKVWTIGCAALGIVALIAALLVGSLMLGKTVQANLKATRTKFERMLPLTIGNKERQRTRHNLQKFMDTVAATEDPNPLIGGFVRRATEAMKDGRLTRREIADLNQYLESVVDPEPESTQ